MSKPIIVLCPSCKQKSIYDKNNPYRPFCSERCKIFDLAAWAKEDYRIEGNETDKPSSEDE